MLDKFAILKEERTAIDALKDLRNSLHADLFTVAELEDICAQLHADFFLTICALESSDKDYINELRLAIAELFRAVFKKTKEAQR